MVDEGTFRNDLYYRIAVVPVSIPPLQDRKCDIMPLVEYFLSQKNTDIVLSPEAKLQLFRYSWPGNVRELKNVIERSILMADDRRVVRKILIDIDLYESKEETPKYSIEDIPCTWEEFKKYKSRVLMEKKLELERNFVERLLIKSGGNVSVSAKNAGIDRRQFQDMIKTLDVDVSLFKGV